MSYANLTALCVEDEPLVSLEMSKVLREMGFGNVLTAHRLPTAFEHIERERVDLAVLDYDLGYGERTTELGLTLASKGARVLFSSGYERAALDQRLQAFELIEKPAMTSELRRRISALLAQAA